MNFKSFVPYVVTGQGFDIIRELEFDDEPIAHLAQTDPTGGEWSRRGFAPVLPDQDDTFIWSPEDGVYLMNVQFNERILPGKVRNEHLAERVADIQTREGRVVGKKEFAELRDDVEFELLPKAFIRRSNVPVLFVAPRYLFIFASSAKRCDDVTHLLYAIKGMVQMEPGEPVTIQRIRTPQSPTDLFLKSMQDDDLPYEPLDQGTLTLERSTVRFKGKDALSGEVQELVSQGYVPTELRLGVWAEGNNGANEYNPIFTLNSQFTFKQLEVEGVHIEKANPDVYAASLASSLVILSRTLTRLMDNIVDLHLGGHADSVVMGNTHDSCGNSNSL